MQEYPSKSVRPSPPPGKRKGSFRDAESVEASCAHVRGVLIARLDAVYEGRVLPLLRRFRLADWESVELFQEFQLAFFPEEFAEDVEIAMTLAQLRSGRVCGLVPRPTTGLLNRAGADRLTAYAAKLGAKIRARPVVAASFTPSLFD